MNKQQDNKKSPAQKGKAHNPEGHNQYTKKETQQSKAHNPEGHNQYTNKK